MLRVEEKTNAGRRPCRVLDGGSETAPTPPPGGDFALALPAHHELPSGIVHGETIVTARVEPAPGLDHTAIERALADTPLATWRDAIALHADAMRVISAPPAA